MKYRSFKVNFYRGLIKGGNMKLYKFVECLGFFSLVISILSGCAKYTNLPMYAFLGGALLFVISFVVYLKTPKTI